MVVSWHESSTLKSRLITQSVRYAFTPTLLAGKPRKGTVRSRRASPRARNTGCPSHIHHKEDEASYVLEGEIMAQIGDQLIQAPVGTLIFKPKRLSHTFCNQGSAPARILEIISPAGFEKYFEELAELVAPGGPPDIPRLLTLAQKYDLELDMSSVLELSQKYHVSLGGPGQPA